MMLRLIALVVSQWTKRLRLLASLMAAMAAMAALLSSVTSARGDEPSTESQVARLLSTRCLVCHSSQKSEGGYSVETFAQARRAGDSGKQPIVNSKPDSSELLRRLVTKDANERMPADAEPLKASDVELIRHWIEEGSHVDAQLESQAIYKWHGKQAETPQHYDRPLPITALAMTSASDQVWLSGYGEIIAWRLEPMQLQHRLAVAGTQVTDIEISRSGQWLAVASGVPGEQGTIELFDLAAIDEQTSKSNTSASANSSEQNPQTHRTTVSAVWRFVDADASADMAFSPDGNTLVVGRQDGSLVVVDLRHLMDKGDVSLRNLTPHADAILAVQWSSSGERLMTGSRDRTAKLFDTKSFELIANYDRHERAVGGVAFVGDNPVSFDETGKLRLWPGDDNDKTLAEQDNLARFLERIACADDHVWLADAADLRSFSVTRKTSEDGKDEAGNPKIKKTVRLKEDKRLASGSNSWLLSLSVTDKVVVAGTDRGEVYMWKHGETMPALHFNALP